MSRLHVLAVEFEHGLAIVGFNFNAEVWLGCSVLMVCGVYIGGVYFDGQSPVLADRGVVDVDAEVLVWDSTDGKPVRASLSPVV